MAKAPSEDVGDAVASYRRVEILSRLAHQQSAIIRALVSGIGAVASHASSRDTEALLALVEAANTALETADEEMGRAMAELPEGKTAPGGKGFAHG
jgi:hypothetical protein